MEATVAKLTVLQFYMPVDAAHTTVLADGTNQLFDGALFGHLALPSQLARRLHNPHQLHWLSHGVVCQ